MTSMTSIDPQTSPIETPPQQPPRTYSRPSFFRSLSSPVSSQDTSGYDLFGRKDKPRLFLALYTRGGSNLGSSYSSSMTCDSHHWVLLVGSQSPSRSRPATVYQITHTEESKFSNTAPFLYEETELQSQSQSEAQSQALLARIALAKVLSEDRIRTLLRSLPSSLPATPNHTNHADSGYDTDEFQVTPTCLNWVKEAYKALTSDPKCLRGYVGPDDWPEVEEIARMYMRRKRQQGRFGNQGRQRVARSWNTNEIPTWNFWENRETTN